MHQVLLIWNRFYLNLFDTDDFVTKISALNIPV